MNGIAEKYGKTVSNNFLFRGMEAEKIDEALDILDSTVKQYKKGELVHCGGSPMKKFGMVLSGTLQVCSDDIEGDRMIMAEVAAGNSFGESICFLRLEHSPVYITSLEASTVLWMSVKRLFDGKGGLYAEIEKRFVSLMAMRTLDMNSRIQILSKIKLRDKLITYFTDVSGRQGTDTVVLNMSREDMAAYLGTNRSALSRELSEMKKEGLIDFSRNKFKLIFGKR